YNVNSKALNPLLVQVMGLGYFYHMYRHQPILRDGGVLILTHPCSDKFDPVHHPSYIEFFNRVLTETTDSYTIEKKYKDELAYNPSYIEMYRRGNAYHGAHPCYMWYWGQRGREKTSRVIVVGADNATVPAIMGWERPARCAARAGHRQAAARRHRDPARQEHPADRHDRLRRQGRAVDAAASLSGRRARVLPRAARRRQHRRRTVLQEGRDQRGLRSRARAAR